MAYNRDLAERIREALADQASVREVNMFGGLSFMVNEKLAISANTHGDLMVRCDPEQVDTLLREEEADWAEMNGHTMGRGWLRVGANGILSEKDLGFWIDAALRYNSTVTGRSTAVSRQGKRPDE